MWFTGYLNAYLHKANPSDDSSEPSQLFTKQVQMYMGDYDCDQSDDNEYKRSSVYHLEEK